MIEVITTLEPQIKMLRNFSGVTGEFKLSDYRRTHRLIISLKEEKTSVHASLYPLSMEVNHGRWCAKCLECLSGICTGSLWNEACCFYCGAVYFQVIWPPEKLEIERLLLLRPPSRRNWLVGETLEDLRQQNREHGLEI